MVITEGRCICQQNVVPTWLRHQDHGHQGDRQPWHQGQTAYSSETKEIVRTKTKKDYQQLDFGNTVNLNWALDQQNENDFV